MEGRGGRKPEPPPILEGSCGSGIGVEFKALRVVVVYLDSSKLDE